MLGDRLVQHAFGRQLLALAALLLERADDLFVGLARPHLGHGPAASQDGSSAVVGSVARGQTPPHLEGAGRGQVGLARLAPGFAIDLKPQQTCAGPRLERGDTDLPIAPKPSCSPDQPTGTLFIDPFVRVIDVAPPTALAEGMSLDDFRAADFVAARPMRNRTGHVGHARSASAWPCAIR
jgi:hypothetical protein